MWDRATGREKGKEKPGASTGQELGQAGRKYGASVLAGGVLGGNGFQAFDDAVGILADQERYGVFVVVAQGFLDVTPFGADGVQGRIDLRGVLLGGAEVVQLAGEFAGKLVDGALFTAAEEAGADRGTA